MVKDVAIVWAIRLAVAPVVLAVVVAIETSRFGLSPGHWSASQATPGPALVIVMASSPFIALESWTCATGRSRGLGRMVAALETLAGTVAAAFTIWFRLPGVDIPATPEDIGIGIAYSAAVFVLDAALWFTGLWLWRLRGSRALDHRQDTNQASAGQGPSRWTPTDIMSVIGELLRRIRPGARARVTAGGGTSDGPPATLLSDPCTIVHHVTADRSGGRTR